MSQTYYYTGHDTIGAHIAHRLGASGWTRVDDVADADFAFTYCTHAGALEDAYFEQDGLVKNAEPGTVLIDLSPSTPSFAREVSAVATVSDLVPVEAPIALIDPHGAEAFDDLDNIVCYLAGDEDAIESARDVLALIAGTVVATGGAGTAQLAKTAHTVQVAGQIMSAVEADAIRRATRAAGLVGEMGEAGEPKARNAAPASSSPFLTELGRSTERAIAQDDFEGPYTVEMLMAEVVATMTAADDVDLILPQLEAIMHLLEVIAVIGGADMAPASVSLAYRSEEESARVGLDWTRAASLFSDHEHHHGEHGDEDDLDDYDAFDDYESFGGFGGGFGGYSAN